MATSTIAAVLAIGFLVAGLALGVTFCLIVWPPAAFALSAVACLYVAWDLSRPRPPRAPGEERRP